MISKNDVIKLWNEIANSFNIEMTPQEHSDVVEVLHNNLNNLFEDKIVEQEKLLDEMNKSGVR